MALPETIPGDDVSTTELAATTRTEFGKGAARRLRAADRIPAVIYGHGEPPRHVALPGHDTMLAVKNSNALLTISVEGDGVLALVKDVQRDPVKLLIEHVDLVVVRRGEKVQVDVSVHLDGEAAPQTVVSLAAQTLQMEVEATDIPEHLTVSIDGLPAGTQISADAVRMPPGAILLTDPETLVVNITEQISEEALEADLGADQGVAAELSDSGAAAGPDALSGEEGADTDE